MPGKPTRREMLLASGAATGALSGCLSVAQGQPDDCVPPGQYECPDDHDYLAKLEFEGCSFTQDEGDCSISITNYEDKEDEECEPVAFDWKVDGGEECVVYDIRVNGGNDCEDHEVDGTTEGTISTDLENQGGQRAAISNVIFCGEITVEETPEDTPEDASENTPEDTPEETPEDTPEETPENTPEDTPAETSEQTPEETPTETPTDEDGDKKEKGDSEESPC